MKSRAIINVLYLIFCLLIPFAYACPHVVTANAGNDRTVCVGNTVSGGSASCDLCSISYSDSSWSAPGGSPSSGSGVHFSCTYDTPGYKTITVNAECNAEYTDSDSVTITVVGVVSLLPNEGTEIDDGDGNPNTKSFVVCKADSGVVTVTATPNPSIAEGNLPSCWSLTGGTGTGKLSRTVDKTVAGITTIICTAGTSSKTTIVYVVELESLLPDEGVEVDDYDNDPDTKLFLTCIATSGEITFTAKPNPQLEESKLPSCWTLTGGIGTSKLERKVDKTSAGETVIEWMCDTSTKTTTIWVIKGEVNLSSSSACDGEEVDIDLVLTPAGAKNYVTAVQWSAAEPSGVTNYGSPSSAGLTYSQCGDITEWKIDNARWYSNQTGHCNDTADWENEADFQIAGSVNCTTNYDPPTTIVTFTASASLGSNGCMDGSASPTNYFSGVPAYTTVLNQQTQLWETTVAQGTFRRDVQATSTYTVAGGTNSQFYNMVRENRGQLPVFGKTWDSYQ